jgi:hypothetical protein
VPYGYNIAFTAGWLKQNDLSRPYFGINANRYLGSEKENFFSICTGRLFLNKGNAEDASVLVGGSVFSKLYLFKHSKCANT